jgi:hypothetical protein
MVWEMGEDVGYIIKVTGSNDQVEWVSKVVKIE